MKVRSRSYHRGRSRKHPRLNYLDHSGGETTEAEYGAMCEAQNGVCAICGRFETVRGGISLAIDHNHTSGRARGLPRYNCNTGLGLLRKATAY